MQPGVVKATCTLILPTFSSALSPPPLNRQKPETPHSQAPLSHLGDSFVETSVKYSRQLILASET